MIRFQRLFATGLLVLSTSAFANPPVAKFDYKAAKSACEAEGKKGKDLRACIKAAKKAAKNG